MLLRVLFFQADSKESKMILSLMIKLAEAIAEYQNKVVLIQVAFKVGISSIQWLLQERKLK